MLTTKNGCQVSMRKNILVVGGVLLGILLISILVIAVIGVMEGDGARSWKLVRGGRGGTVFPVILLPIFLAVVVIGFFWIKRRFFPSKREYQKHDTDESQDKEHLT